MRVGDGVTVREAECTDPAQPVADVEIDAEPIAIAPVDLESALTTPLVAAAADLVGVAGAALDRSVEYAKTRRQFGKPIGAFQGIKHALADNYVALERARSLTYAAAARLDDPATSSPPAVDRRGAGQGGGRRRGGRLCAHRGPGPRRAWRRPGSTTCTSMSGMPGRAPRCWATAARSTTRWAAASPGAPHEPTQVDVAEFGAWLTEFLPERLLRALSRVPLGHRLAARLTNAPRSRPDGCSRPGRREHGGRSLGLRDAMEIRLEAAMRSAPKLPNVAGPGVAAPGIRQFGTPAQIDRLLVPLLRGDEWWALGMSEPEAGSDFAGLRTRAVRDGDVFRVNGQKIWTTQAHQSRWCTLYARTDPDAPKHRGISCLILDLESPGVTIEPIRMASISDETFCEVFLDDVEVPADNLLGPLNGGWNVAMSSLHHERQMIWIMNWVEIKRGLDSVRDAKPPGRLRLRDVYRRTRLAARRRRSVAGHRISRAGQRTRRTAQPGSRHPEATRIAYLAACLGTCSAAAAGPGSATDSGSALRTPGRAGRDHLRRNIGGPAQHHRRAAARVAEGMTTMDYDLGDDAGQLRQPSARADCQPHPR